MEVIIKLGDGRVYHRSDHIYSPIRGFQL